MGNKLLGSHNGYISLQGAARTPTWTLLGKTARKADTTILLKETV